MGANENLIALHGPYLCVKTISFMTLMQCLIDREPLLTWCHVGHHVDSSFI